MIEKWLEYGVKRWTESFLHLKLYFKERLNEAIMVKGLSKHKDFDSSMMKVYNVLANPNKRKIILYLGEKGKASATELRDSLKISTGSLYYNLDDMREFVAQDEDRRYFLTPWGKKIYEIIVNEKEHFHFLLPDSKARITSFADRISSFLVPYVSFKKLSQKQFLLLGIYTVLFALSFLGISYTDSNSLLLSIRQDIEKISFNIGLLRKSQTFFILSWVGLYLFIELMSRILGSNSFNAEFFLAIFIASSPLYLYPYLYIFLTLIGLDRGLVHAYLLPLFLRLLQVVTLPLLTACIMVYKKISREKAFIISSLAFYLSLILENFL